MQSVHPSIHGLLSLLQLFPLPHKGGGSYPICEPVLGNPLGVSQHPLRDYIQATTIQWDIHSPTCVCVIIVELGIYLFDKLLHNKNSYFEAIDWWVL